MGAMEAGRRPQPHHHPRDRTLINCQKGQVRSIIGLASLGSTVEGSGSPSRLLGIVLKDVLATPQNMLKLIPADPPPIQFGGS